MRDLVFSDSTAKAQLEAIVHPLVKAEMHRQIGASKTAIVVLDLPLLAESNALNGWRPQLDQVVVVDCLESTQIARVVARSQMTEEQVRAVIGNQALRLERLAIADKVIVNNDLSLIDLKVAVKTAIIDK